MKKGKRRETIKVPCDYTILVARQNNPTFCPVVAFNYNYNCDTCVSRGWWHRLMDRHYNRSNSL